MPTLLQIAVEGNTGSTGTIAEAIGKIAIQNGWESYIAHGRFPRPSESRIIKIGSSFDVVMHGIETRLFDNHCFGSRSSTHKLIQLIKYIKPDIIHLHHLHGYYVNIQILFDYLQSSKIPVVWTFHDCWAFTGHCIYFDFVGCDKWKSECDNCPQKNEYPTSWFLDRSKKNFHLKKKLFNSIENIVIVPVSYWLEDLVKQSFLSSLKVSTIHNGVDLNLFKPLSSKGKIFSKYKLQNKFIILGVASPWVKRKGLHDFIELSKFINEDEIIILIGLNVDQIRDLPTNIIGISRTDNRQELVEFYSDADVFVNPTLEDNFPTTNIESLACGTPVITYNTGGSPEAINNETGIIVEKHSVSGLVKAIAEVKANGKVHYAVKCRERAELHFSKDERFMNYFKLYSELLNNDTN